MFLVYTLPSLSFFFESLISKPPWQPLALAPLPPFPMLASFIFLSVAQRHPETLSFHPSHLPTTASPLTSWLSSYLRPLRLMYSCVPPTTSSPNSRHPSPKSTWALPSLHPQSSVQLALPCGCPSAASCYLQFIGGDHIPATPGARVQTWTSEHVFDQLRPIPQPSRKWRPPTQLCSGAGVVRQA